VRTNADSPRPVPSGDGFPLHRTSARPHLQEAAAPRRTGRGVDELPVSALRTTVNALPFRADGPGRKAEVPRACNMPWRRGPSSPAHPIWAPRRAIHAAQPAGTAATAAIRRRPPQRAPDPIPAFTWARAPARIQGRQIGQRHVAARLERHATGDLRTDALPQPLVYQSTSPTEHAIAAATTSHPRHASTTPAKLEPDTGRGHLPSVISTSGSSCGRTHLDPDLTRRQRLRQLACRTSHAVDDGRPLSTRLILRPLAALSCPDWRSRALGATSRSGRRSSGSRRGRTKPGRRHIHAASHQRPVTTA